MTCRPFPGSGPTRHDRTMSLLDGLLDWLGIPLSTFVIGAIMCIGLVAMLMAGIQIGQWRTEARFESERSRAIMLAAQKRRALAASRGDLGHNVIRPVGAHRSELFEETRKMRAPREVRRQFRGDAG